MSRFSSINVRASVTAHPLGPVIAEVDAARSARTVAHHAAHAALKRRTALHLVASIASHDSRALRRARLEAPTDIGHMLTPKGDCEALLREVRDELVDSGLLLEIHTHAVGTHPARALRAVARQTGASLIVVSEARALGVVGRLRICGAARDRPQLRGEPVVLA